MGMNDMGGKQIIVDALVAGRLILGFLFVGAALAKTRKVPKTREFLSRLGIPQWALRPAGVGVVATEATTGALLVSGAGTRIGGIAAASLFSIFIGVLVAADRKAVPCACFGDEATNHRLGAKLAWRIAGLCASITVAFAGEAASSIPSPLAILLAFAIAGTVAARNPGVRAAVRDWLSAPGRAAATPGDSSSGQAEPDATSIVRRRFLQTTGGMVALSLAAPFTAFGRSLGVSPCYPECEPDETCFCSATGQCYCTAKPPPPPTAPPAPSEEPAVVTEAERIAACIASCERNYVCAQQNCYCLAQACEQGWTTKLPGVLYTGAWGIRLWLASGMSCLADTQHCINLAHAGAADCSDDCVADPTRTEASLPAYLPEPWGAPKWDSLPTLAVAIEAEAGRAVAHDWLIRRLDMQIFLPVTLWNELVAADTDVSPERIAIWLFLHEVATGRAAEMVQRSATAELLPAEAGRNAEVLRTVARAAEDMITAFPPEALRAGERFLRTTRKKAMAKRSRRARIECCTRQKQHLAESRMVVPALSRMGSRKTPASL